MPFRFGAPNFVFDDLSVPRITYAGGYGKSIFEAC